MISNQSQKWQQVQHHPQAPQGGQPGSGGAILSRQKQLQDKSHQQKLSQSQMQSAGKDGSIHRMSVQQVTKKDSQKLQSSVDRRRAANHQQVKVFNQNSANSSNTSVKPATFSNSGSCSNLQMGNTPPHKLGQNGGGFIQKQQQSVTNNMRQLSVNTGTASLQQQLNNQTFLAAKFSGGGQQNQQSTQMVMTELGNAPKKQYSFGQNKQLFQSQMQTSTFNRHQTSIGINQAAVNMYQKQSMQQRIQVNESGSSNGIQIKEASGPGGSHQVINNHLIMNGKALQHRGGENSNNFKNGFNLQQQNGVGQYSLRQGPPAHQSQNNIFGTKVTQSTWQVQKKSSHLGVPHQNLHQQAQKSSIIPEINSATQPNGGYSSAMSKDTKHAISFPISHHNSMSSHQTGPQQLSMALQQSSNNNGSLPLYFNNQASKTQGQPTVSRGLSYGLTNNKSDTPVRVMTLQPNDSDEPLHGNPVQQFSPNANTGNFSALKQHHPNDHQVQTPMTFKDESPNKNFRMNRNDHRSQDNSTSVQKEPQSQKMKFKSPYTSAGMPGVPVTILNNTQGPLGQQLLTAQPSVSRPTFMTSQLNAPGNKNFSSSNSKYRQQQPEYHLQAESKSASKTIERQAMPGKTKQSSQFGKNQKNGQKMVYQMVMVNQNGQILPQGNRLPIESQAIVHVQLANGQKHDEQLSNQSFQVNDLRSANLIVWPNHALNAQQVIRQVPQQTASGQLSQPFQQQPLFYSTASTQHAKHLKTNLAHFSGNVSSGLLLDSQIQGQNNFVQLQGGNGLTAQAQQMLAEIDQQSPGTTAAILVPTGPQVRIIAQKQPESRQSKFGQKHVTSLNNIIDTNSSEAISHEYTNSYSKQEPANGQLIAVQNSMKSFNNQKINGKKRSLSSEKKLESMGIVNSTKRSRAEQSSYENGDYTPLKTEKMPSGIIRVTYDQQSLSARGTHIDHKRNTVIEKRGLKTHCKTRGSGRSSRENSETKQQEQKVTDISRVDQLENIMQIESNMLRTPIANHESATETCITQNDVTVTSVAMPTSFELQTDPNNLPDQIHKNKQKQDYENSDLKQLKHTLDDYKQKQEQQQKVSNRVAKIGSNRKGMEQGQLSCSLDDLVINIQDDEEEIGPIDDDEEDEEEALIPDDAVAGHNNTEAQTVESTKKEDQQAIVNNDLDNYTGYYDCGDEPDEDDSGVDEDEQEEFDDCAEEDGEDDMLEEGEEEVAIEQKATTNMHHNQPMNPNPSHKPASSTNEVDLHSKISTSCTNIGGGSEQISPLLKIKVQNTDGKIKRKYIKSKKTTKGRSKVYGEGGEDLEGLGEEERQRRIDLNILDKQLDQLVIQKPATLINQNGKDRSLKEAFLRRPPNNLITLTYGPIPGRPPTIFFNYPPFLKTVRPQLPNSTIKLTQDDMKPYSNLNFKINNSTHTYNCVVNAFKTAGFRLCESGSWNCLWTGLIRPSKLKYMNQYQKINHFAGAWNIGHKGNLWRNVQRQRRRHGREFEICPPTYIFPEDYKRWNTDRETSGFRDMYIMKPTCSSCGRGIRIIGKKQSVGKRQGYLVQKYLSKPHLLRGYKYDMRIYIVVTGFEPLKAYQFSEGLVRLATQPYSTAKGTLKKRFIHLTNFSINKKAENYKKNDAGVQVQGENGQQIQPVGAESSSTAQDTEEAEMSSKWSLDQLREEYEKMGISYDNVFKQVKSLCIKTLMAVEPQITTSMRTAKHRNQCFEIYGFDVIIDHKLRPWLLEVNVAPSLSSSSPYDKQVKSKLLCDTLHLVGFQPFDRKMFEEGKKKELRHRLLGFEPTKNSKSINRQHEDQDPFTNNQLPQQQKYSLSQTPVKQKILQAELGSADKFERSNTKSNSIRDKITIPSFLDGFNQLTEDDMEIIADFEEEQSRKGHFETIFPTRETIEALGNHFDIQRHANSVLWQYIRQKQPIHHVKSYFRAHPYIA